MRYSQTDTTHPLFTAKRRNECTEWNVERSGFQNVETKLLAITEELGELSKAHLEAQHEAGDHERVQRERNGLAPLLFQRQWSIEDREESDG